MIRIGTVGTGFIVDNFVDAVSRVPDLDVACVYSRDAEKAKAFADKHGIADYSADRSAFLNNSALDFIYVASPNSLHFEWTKDAMLAGRNVICEKPFVSTKEEAEELIRISREKKLFLFEAITVPHLPNYRLLREHLGDIGTLKLVQMNFSQYSSRYKAFMEGKNPNVFNPEFSGGCLMDINYYNLWFALGLFGEPEEIRYFANIAENGIDVSGMLLMKYKDFVCGAFGAKDSRSENMVQIQGDQGYIRVEQESSRCLSFDVCVGETRLHINEQTDSNALYYELCDFKEIYMDRNYEKRDELLKATEAAVGLVQKARVEAGIHFPADDRAWR